MVDYFGIQQKNNANTSQPTGESEGWGKAGAKNEIWSLEELLAIKKEINSFGLELEAIEIFDPAHWYDILLDGPKKKEQIENLKQLIRHVGASGIPVFGYNFSLVGVPSRSVGPYARGEAESVGMNGNPDSTPIPNGMVWNMVYDKSTPEGTVPKIDHDELWSRYSIFWMSLYP